MEKHVNQAQIPKLGQFWDALGNKSESTKSGYRTAIWQFIKFIFADAMKDHVEQNVEQYFSEDRDHFADFKKYIQTILISWRLTTDFSPHKKFLTNRQLIRTQFFITLMLSKNNRSYIMGLFEKFFGKSKIEPEDITHVIALLDEVMNISVAAEKAAVKANNSMPVGIGARISHERYEISESAFKANNEITQMMATLEQIEILTKKGVSVASVERSENDEKIKKVAKIFIEIYEKVNDIKQTANSTLVIAKEAAKKAESEADATKLNSHQGMGQRIIDSNKAMITDSQVTQIMNEQRRVDALAENAKNKAIGARELRRNVYDALVVLKKMIDPLQEFKKCLSNL